LEIGVKMPSPLKIGEKFPKELIFKELGNPKELRNFGSSKWEITQGYS